MMKLRYSQSVEIHRGTYGEDGSTVFSGTPVDTVSGSVFKQRIKDVVTEGEVITVNSQGFLEPSADVHVADHLRLSAPAAVSGQRYEVVQVLSGHDHRGRSSHVGVELRDTVSN
jgi:hypothetical protein